MTPMIPNSTRCLIVSGSAVTQALCCTVFLSLRHQGLLIESLTPGHHAAGTMGHTSGRLFAATRKCHPREADTLGPHSLLWFVSWLLLKQEGTGSSLPKRLWGRPLSLYLLLSTDPAGPCRTERQVHTVGERRAHTVGPHDVISGQSLHPSSFHSWGLGTCLAPPTGLSCPGLPAPEAPVVFIFWELEAQWDPSPEPTPF